MANINITGNFVDNEYIYSIDVMCYKTGSWQSVSQTIPATRVQTYSLNVTFADTGITLGNGCYFKTIDELNGISYIAQPVVAGVATSYDLEADAQSHTFALPGGFNLLPMSNKGTADVIKDALTQLSDLPIGSRGTANVFKSIGTARSKLPFGNKGTAEILKDFS